MENKPIKHKQKAISKTHEEEMLYRLKRQFLDAHGDFEFRNHSQCRCARIEFSDTLRAHIEIAIEKEREKMEERIAILYMSISVIMMGFSWIFLYIL